ncbi:uncharacterized protein LOC117151495 [Bombus impatiens]|uniref:Uncharacterized protein LOC117151495 n=1 Tax=Bombus impatiens TaxID=132113 RepID=A0A6P8KYH6_BOMIM|nr:uncharacterized protein LOC117151495 [Bombus impatiens]
MIVPNPEQRSWEEASGNVRDKMTGDQRFVVARKQEGRGVSGAQRSRPRRNATPARINRSRDPGEFIRFVAASLKAARVSFASRSLRGAGGRTRRPPCVYTLERTAYRHRGEQRKKKPRKPEEKTERTFERRTNRDTWLRIRSAEEKSPLDSSLFDSSSLSCPFFLSIASLLSFFLLRRRPRDESRRRLDNGESHLDKKRGRDHWKCSNPGGGSPLSRTLGSVPRRAATLARAPTPITSI